MENLFQKHVFLIMSNYVCRYVFMDIPYIFLIKNMNRKTIFYFVEILQTQKKIVFPRHIKYTTVVKH